MFCRVFRCGRRVDPVLAVVCFAAGGWPVATGEQAAAVAEAEVAAHGRGGGGGFDHLGKIEQLPQTDVRRRFGQNPFDVSGEVVLQCGDGLADHASVTEPDVARFPCCGSGGHPVGQRAAEQHPFGCPAVRLTRHVP